MQTSESIPVGIDLGTTYSVIAHLDHEGHPWTIRNSEGDAITPSVVFFDRSGIVVGKEAVKLTSFEPERTAICAKRDMGSAAYSKPIAGEQLPPEVIQACVLRKLRRDAELVTGPIKKVVITVPAYFNEPRRKATQDAGRLAGLEVIDIINEPTAAAIAAGAQRALVSGQPAAGHERIMVFDLGGGTFDVTVMEIKEQNFDTLATGGDVHLGGMDWDQRLVDFLTESFRDEHGGDDLREQSDVAARMLREVEDVKRMLSVREEAMLPFEHHGARIRLAISRAQFEDLTRDLVERTRFTANRVLREAKLKWTDLDRLLVVGGSTRMPMVLEMLERESGRKPDQSVSADEAVAHGAALYAGLLLKGDRKSSVVQRVKNVSAHNMCVLGVDKQTGRPRSRVMIPRNTPLPASHRSRFHTHKAGQKSVMVQIVEGGDASGTDATPIGRCVISDLPAALPAQSPVDVVFSYAANGRLTVEAQLEEANAAAQITIERSSGLADSMLKAWEEKLDSGRILCGESEVDNQPAEKPQAPAQKPAPKKQDESLETLDFDAGEPDQPRGKAKPAGRPAAKKPSRSAPSKPQPQSKDEGLDRFLDFLQ